jgi:hypothetical protein
MKVSAEQVEPVYLQVWIVKPQLTLHQGDVEMLTITNSST